MAAINELISRIQDPELRASIQAEVDKLSRQKKLRLQKSMKHLEYSLRF